MDDAARDRIAALATLLHGKRMGYDALCMRNTAPMNGEELEMHRVALAIAYTELLEAQAALWREQGRISLGPIPYSPSP